MSVFEENTLITNLRVLKDAIEQDLFDVYRNDAEGIENDEVWVETTPEKYEKFLAELQQLIQNDYPDAEVVLKTREEGNKVIITGYRITVQSAGD